MRKGKKCSELGAKANEVGSRILYKYSQLSVDYDRETNHGATQGAMQSKL